MILLYLLTLHNHYRSASSAPCEFIRTSSSVSEDGTRYVFTTNYRSTASIVISCLSTLLLCTWFTVHPNVCKHEATSWKILRTKLYLFAWALLVPELVMMFACRQWFGARYIAKKIGHEWTTIEGQFLQMGGFIFLCNGQYEFLVPELLLADECKDPRYSAARQKLGELTKFHKSILDRSKGDRFAKGLVVIQTLWFTIQCIARAVQRLDLTELEIITVAYALLNGVTYFFWWDKPLDVQFPIVIPLEGNDITPARDSEDTQESAEKEGVGHTQDSHALLESDSNGEDKDSSSKQPKQSVLQTIWRILKGCMWVVGSIILIPLTLAASPIIISSVTFIYAVSEIASSSPVGLAEDRQLAAPSYYGYNIPRGTRSISFIVISFLASIFGAIHCISWSFSFPAPKLRVVWRICSLYITLSPLGGASLTAINLWFKNSKIAGLVESIISVPTLLAFLLYIPARIVLLAIALRTLADIPATGHQSIEWSEFIPHI